MDQDIGLEDEEPMDEEDGKRASIEVTVDGQTLRVVERHANQLRAPGEPIISPTTRDRLQEYLTLAGQREWVKEWVPTVHSMPAAPVVPEGTVVDDEWGEPSIVDIPVPKGIE